MFVSDKLREHIDTSETIKSDTAIIAEWNMNYASNIAKVGNYRYRPGVSDSKYQTIINTYDTQDVGYFYTEATDADVVIDGGVDDEGIPTVFLSKKQKENLLYSLEDCFGRFRPRSGINKARYFEYSRHLQYSNPDLARRPRYYPSHKDDAFKYWSSYRTEGGEEVGIANRPDGSQYLIDDASPFVIYNEAVPANRVVVKMQTHVGDTDLGPFSASGGSIADPAFGDENSQTPVTWKIQALDSNGTWYDLSSFDASSTRSNGSPVIGPDGYVEIQYGIQAPEDFKESFHLMGQMSSSNLLPEFARTGQSYLVLNSEIDQGMLFVWNGLDYSQIVPNYVWTVVESEVSRESRFVTALNDPKPFVNTATERLTYREFEYIHGLRVVVKTMKKPDSTFDLIELSPRLSVDIADYVKSYDIIKSASDLSTAGLPVGQLLASTGQIQIFDYDNSFNMNNSSSIVSKYLAKNIKFQFYEIVLDVDGMDYFVPIKSMYADGFPEFSAKDRSVSVELRDLFFYFESMTAPQIFIQDVSLTTAVSLLLDSIGFTNYKFFRADSDVDLVIPSFFIPPDVSVADVLERLAISAQCAMFFDEYNNFILMQKNYLMPSEGERQVNLTLYGSKDFEKENILRNKNSSSILSGIAEVSSQSNPVYNAGTISYTSRHIQKTYGSVRQATMVDSEKSWVYRYSNIWEVTGTENITSINQVMNSQSSYVLSAIPLNSTLSADIPEVRNGQIINNVMDLGEGVPFITRHNGYFYSAGEVIKYDAVQYSVAGLQGESNVWISSTQDYQNYFSKLRFNGKIYPTGLVRIYCEPFYEIVDGITRLKDGQVRRHGRGQFGTSIVEHSAGLSSYWTDDSTVKASYVDSRYLFSTTVPNSTKTIEPVSPNKSTRNGIIANFMSSGYIEDTTLTKLRAPAPGTVQSSALVFNGPNYTVDQNALDYVTLIPKALNDKFMHFGTRMRIVGKIESSETNVQTSVGGNAYYVSSGDDPTMSTTISGGSGGLAVMLDSNNNGYYFEIIALSEANIDGYDNVDDIHNVIFYKIGENGNVPTKLWGGLAKIIVDSGKFTGQARMAAEENPTVYDLGVEYRNIGTKRRFYLYINGQLVASVDDENPMPIHNNFAPFIRGSSRVMFENLYALGANYTQNTTYSINTPISSAITDPGIGFDESFQKYALSGIVQSTYLSGINPIEPPKYNIYYEEFGTIMREASYFNVRYDKAYPALYAKLAPTFSKIKGYVASGFIGGSYGAEFLIFNSTDTMLSLDETTGNYLRILGIVFTQESSETLSVDDYFRRRSDFSNPVVDSSSQIISPVISKADYLDIKNSRSTYGTNEFSLTADYIQSLDAANEIMGWITSKIIKPRKSVGLRIFADPMIQLGDIISINYKDANEKNQIVSESDRFVVYSIEYSKSSAGPTMVVYLSEVV